MRWYIGFLFLLPMPLYAYLDPGTGNALLYLIFGIFGTVVYALKGWFYAIKAKITGQQSNAIVNHPISLFSEGANYWSTFEPIVSALLKHKIPFNYYSMDIHDPALAIQDDLMEAKYIGQGTKAFVFLNHLDTKILLSTTPNIGNDDFALKRSSKIDCLVHVLHGFGDIGYYRKGSIDAYDVIITSADFCARSIMDIQQIRSMKPKEIMALGLPYFDYLYAKSKRNILTTTPTTILIGPSWGNKSLLRVGGIEFIKILAQNNYTIILRPHPHSFKVEKEFIENCIEELSIFPNVTMDRDRDGTISMSQSHLLISDNSGIRYDFAFIYERPVITLKLDYSGDDEYEFKELGYDWQMDNSEKIGLVLSATDLDHIAHHVETALALPVSNLQEFRDQAVVNIGQSGEKIAQWLKQRREECTTSI